MTQTMPTQEYHTRRFLYDGKEIPNVPAELTIEDVKKHLAVYFPELGNGKSRRRCADDYLPQTGHQQGECKQVIYGACRRIASDRPHGRQFVSENWLRSFFY